ncbi:MAG: hypothetical protein AB3N16_07870 [Flavobacteriaceae bacterium]
MKKARLRPLTGRRSHFLAGVVSCVLLLATPFIFYSYRLIPETLTETSILGLTIEAGAHGNLNYYAYYFITKVVFAVCFIVWFLNARQWWRWAILVPICMLLFQIMGVVNTSIDYIDEFDFWYSLPVVLPIAAILVGVALRLYNKVRFLDIRERVDAEINTVKKGQDENQ